MAFGNCPNCNSRTGDPVIGLTCTACNPHAEHKKKTAACCPFCGVAQNCARQTLCSYCGYAGSLTPPPRVDGPVSHRRAQKQRKNVNLDLPKLALDEIEKWCQAELKKLGNSCHARPGAQGLHRGRVHAYRNVIDMIRAKRRMIKYNEED